LAHTKHYPIKSFKRVKLKFLKFLINVLQKKETVIDKTESFVFHDVCQLQTSKQTQTAFYAFINETIKTTNCQVKETHELLFSKQYETTIANILVYRSYEFNFPFQIVHCTYFILNLCKVNCFEEPP